MKENRIFRKVWLLVCMCFVFAGALLAMPKEVKAGGEGLRIDIRVHSNEQYDMVVGPNKHATVMQISGGKQIKHVVETWKDYAGYKYDCLFFECEGDLSKLPPVGTRFNLTQVDLPDGYMLDYCELPLTLTFTQEMYNEMARQKAAGEQIWQEMQFDVYVRKAGTKADLNDASIMIESLEYTGKAQNFKGTLKYRDTILKEGKDYTVECSNNIKPGTAKAVFRGLGDFAGSRRELTYEIRPIYLYDAEISGISEQKYTGEMITFPITVKLRGKTLKEGRDYLVRYWNNTEPGRALVYIQGRGIYAGDRYIWFTINRPASLPEKNAAITVGNGKYKVTKSSAVNGTVMFMAPKSTKYTSYTVPSTIKYNGYTFKVTSIYTKAFRNNKSLASVKIGSNVETIGSYAFDGDSKLKSIEFQGLNVKSVGKDVFKGIYSKATIKVPSKRLNTYTRLFKDKGQSKYVKIVK